jgi:hypothetical protein
MNGVRVAPCSISSIARRSAMHADPAARSSFETVPEPMIVPARSRRERVTCSISWWNVKVISRALGLPNHSPFHWTCSGSSKRPSRQALPSSSGVTATGENADDGFALKNPNPVESSRGT